FTPFVSAQPTACDNKSSFIHPSITITSDATGACRAKNGYSIAHAPPAAKGPKKLWQKVGKRPAADAPADVPMEAPGASPEARLAALESRLAESDLRQQESAELLAALAAQNADLVHAVDELQRRARLLGALLGLALLIGGGALVTTLLR
ncbi:hypothetical protein, partial [Zoogloea ramigera]|uniref:hypothetical protein n=1 Tax=Zoogloea ramigera TaxID=350 RepID=UPI003FA227D7